MSSIEQHAYLTATRCGFFQPVEDRVEKVSFLENDGVRFSRSILKFEYNRTRNKTITKERFAPLLLKLWETNAVQAKTNAVKSFMKAGVFPLNPQSIDRSRILKSAASSGARSGTSPHTSSDGTLDAPVPDDRRIAHASGGSSATDVVAASGPRADTLPSTSEAFDILDRVMRETDSIAISDDDSNDKDGDGDVDDDDVDDTDYFPAESTSKPTPVVATQQRGRSKPTSSQLTTGQNAVRVRTTQRGKRKRTNVIGVDTSDEEGMFTHALQLLTDRISFEMMSY